MKLVDLISYFRNGGSYEDFCDNYALNVDSEVVEIYMRTPLNLENELGFFEIEETEGMLDFEFNGLKFFNLFDFYYFLDAIDESNNGENKKLSNHEIAKKLFDYAIDNA